MEKISRAAFNAAYTDDLYKKYLNRLESLYGHIPFRVAETPLFISRELKDKLVANALALTGILSAPEMVARCRKAVPAEFDAPGMDALPNTVQVDFALVPEADGSIGGELIEMQGFPSLYAYMIRQAEIWADELQKIPGLEGDWSWLCTKTEAEGIDVIRRTLLGGESPEETILMDIDPPSQKTRPDFYATKDLYGIDPVCITSLIRRGSKLFRKKDGREIPVKRIYNRLVFDELIAKKIQAPFDFRDDLDVTWCSHPNWYWAWSKYCLPLLDHPCVPKTRLISDLDLSNLPDDLSGYVLKPLFSFAGGGVVIDVSREDILKIPESERHNWILMNKIRYAPAVVMPDGNTVKAEVRVMLSRPPEDNFFTPVLMLVRMSRGKMCGVDFNKNMTWVGGTVGMWRP